MTVWPGTGLEGDAWMVTLGGCCGLRFDVPAVGLETVRVCAAAGIAVLALEAGKTLLLDKEELLRQADVAGLGIVGVDVEGA